MIQIFLNCLILCYFGINCQEVRLNSSWNCLLCFLSILELGRLVKRVDISKIQPQKKGAAKANFICWTLFWHKCWRCLFFPCKLVWFVCSSLQKRAFEIFLRSIKIRFLFTTASLHWFWKATRWVLLTEPPPVYESTRSSKLSTQKCVKTVLFGYFSWSGKVKPSFAFSCAIST